jgi:thiamine-phosphate pyrophosphorylase
MRRELVKDVQLYLVTDAAPQDRPLETYLTDVIEAGVGMVQLRDRTLSDRRLVETARLFAQVCRENGALFIVNDRLDVALLAGADGIHVGQDDAHVDDVRRIAGHDFIIGLSTHSPEQVDAAGRTDVDYIGVGPVYETPTKPGRPAVGLELVRYAAGNARGPFFPIGGIDPVTAPDVVAAGARSLCVLRSIARADDPAAAVRALIDRMTATL